MPAETTPHDLAPAAAPDDHNDDDDDDELKAAAPAKLVDHRSTKRGNKIARAPAAIKLVHVDGDNELPENEDHASTMLLLKSSHQLRVHALQLKLQQQQSILASHDQHLQQQQDLVLHPINLNSKLDTQSTLASNGPLAKDPPKHQGERKSLSAPSGREQELLQAMETQAFSNVDTQEGKEQAESMETQASSSVDECCMSSSSGSTKSPVVLREDLLQVGNAAFCGSSSCQLTSCETSSSSRTNLYNIGSQQIDDGLQQSVTERSLGINGKVSLDGEEHGLPVLKVKKIAIEAYMPGKGGICTIASAVSGLASPSIVSSNSHYAMSELHDCEHDKNESSMGSTLSDGKSSCESTSLTQCKTSHEVDQREPLKSLNTSDPAHQYDITSPSSSSKSLSAAVSADLHVLSSIDEQRLILEKTDEARIRAELELEIERDLEKELETKILLLNRRLEQLHSLQAKRCFKEDPVVTHNPSAFGSNKVAEVKSSSDEGDGLLEVEVKASDHLPKNHDEERVSTFEQDKIMMQPYISSETLAYTSPVSTKTIDGQPDNGIRFSHNTSPVIAWRKLASAALSAAVIPESESSAARLEGKHLSLVPMYSTQAFNSHLHALEERQQGKLNKSSTMKIKGTLQLATSLAARKQKFDWISTLRTGVVSAPVASNKETSPPLKAGRAMCHEEVHDDASNAPPLRTEVSSFSSSGNAHTPHLKKPSPDGNAKVKGEGNLHVPFVLKEGHNSHYHVPIVLKEVHHHHHSSILSEEGRINTGHRQHGAIEAKEAQNNFGSVSTVAMHHDPGLLPIAEKVEEVTRVGSKYASHKHHAPVASSKSITANFFAHTASSRGKEVVRYATPAQSKSSHASNKSKVSTQSHSGNKKQVISSAMFKGKTKEKQIC